MKTPTVSATNMKKMKFKPRTKAECALLDQDMKDLAQFLYWKRKYYQSEVDGQDLVDLKQSSKE